MLIQLIDGVFHIKSSGFSMLTRVKTIREAIDEALAYHLYGVYGDATTVIV